MKINDSRSIIEPSLVLQLLLLDINPLIDAFVSSLPTYFQYLDKKTLNPRRLYFFQRFAQYIFEVRAEKCIRFAVASPDFLRNLVRHLSYAPIVQMFLTILSTNTQLQSVQDALEKETLLADAIQPTKSQLIPKIVENLVIAAENDLPSLIVGLYRLFGALNSNVSLLKEIMSTINCAFIRCIVQQLNNPLSVDEAIGLFDDILFKFIMQHESDSEFFERARACLIESCAIAEMLKSDNIQVIIPHLRLIQSIVKNKVNFLVENEASLFSMISICYKFPWSNVLHCGVANVYLFILQMNEDILSKSFLEANLVKEIVLGLGMIK